MKRRSQNHVWTLLNGDYAQQYDTTCLQHIRLKKYKGINMKPVIIVTYVRIVINEVQF